MNELTKNDILLKGGVFDIKDDFIFNFNEYDMSYKEWKLERDCDTFIESNTYYFKIPVLDIEYKIMCPEIYSYTQFHLQCEHSTVLGWNYFFNYFNLGLFDSRIKYVYNDKSFLWYGDKQVDHKFKDKYIECHIKNECEHNYNRWKLFAIIENPYLLSFENFDREEFWNLNEDHYCNSNNIQKQIMQKTKTKEKQVAYILKDKNTGYYKIGKSINPEKREKTLQSEKPTIILVKKFKNNWENHLHNKYKSQRVRSEWFDLNKIQLKYICTHYE